MRLQLELALQYETGGDLTNFMPNGEWSLIGEGLSLFSLHLTLF